ncbi:MAG: hypothetical protein RUMPE_00594 [Eubacteriales bacterium SKADARSKE-1]|nr:hypothetical protein [Eubacteriales bacterium SKADARSKE-1]
MKIKKFLLKCAAMIFSLAMLLGLFSNNIALADNSQGLSTKEMAEKENALAGFMGFEQWIDVNLNGKLIKVGICSLDRIIEDGSKLHGNFLDKGTREYNKLYRKLDAQDKIEDVQFLNLEVLKPDGKTKYGNLKGHFTFFVEIPDDWDQEKLEIRHVSSCIDEKFKKSFITIDGRRYLYWETRNFNTYAIINKSNVSDIERIEVPTTFSLTRWLILSSAKASSAIFGKNVTTGLKFSYKFPIIEKVEINSDEATFYLKKVPKLWKGKLALCTIGQKDIMETISNYDPLTGFTVSGLQFDTDYAAILFDSAGICSVYTFVSDTY